MKVQGLAGLRSFKQNTARSKILDAELEQQFKKFGSHLKYSFK
jgi:hypothetical protein